MERFAPGWIPTLVMLAAVAVLGRLGVWQLDRYAWREALLAEQAERVALAPVAIAEALRDPEAYALRRAVARGRYDLEHSILVVRVRRGLREGARVLTPLRLEGAQPGAPAVLVDRGWIPFAQQATFLAADPGGGLQEVVGAVHPMRLDEQVPRSAERRVEWLRFNPYDPRQPTALAAQLPYPLAPLLLEREDDGSGEPPQGGIDPPASPVDHRGYALQWFAMAAVAFGTWIGLGVKRARDRHAPATPAPPQAPS